MKHRRLLVAILLGAAGAITHATEWDLAQDFSTTNNPNGAWNYGTYQSDGTFVANTTQSSFFGFAQGWAGNGGDGRPFVGINNTGDAFGSSLGQVILHPDYSTNETPYAGIHWVSPIDGTITVTGEFFAGDSGTVNVFASFNQAFYYFALADQGDDYTFSMQQDVQQGQFLDFFVGPNSSGDPTSGTTPLDIHISSISAPEPASCAAIGLGVLGLLRRRRKN